MGGVGLLVVAVGLATAALAGGSDDPAGVTATWGGAEGEPPCVYDQVERSVRALVTVSGETSEDTDVAVTVTAYADENTSRPVGSTTEHLRVDGTVRERLVLTIAVDRPPHVDEDGVAACALAVTP